MMKTVRDLILALAGIAAAVLIAKWIIDNYKDVEVKIRFWFFEFEIAGWGNLARFSPKIQKDLPSSL